MSENKGPKENKESKTKLTPSPSSNVVSLSEHKCAYVECKKKPDRAHFCNEHFAWFKAGLITKEGQRCSDFDKKYYHYSKKSA